MVEIEKKDIVKAFSEKRKRRNILLYEFYKNSYFKKNYPLSFIAEKISEDLGITITITMVKMIKYRYAKEDIVGNSTEKQNMSGKEIGEEHSDTDKVEEQPKKSRWTNTDDLPKENPFAKQFKERNKGNAVKPDREVGNESSNTTKESGQPKKSKWTNADDLPDDPFDGAFDDWKKKK